MNAPVGVLAVQGDVREHLAAMTRLGVEAIPVKTLAAIESIRGLVLPGGESTTMDKLLRTFGLFEPLRARIREGLACYGSCAGMILLADQIADGTSDQQTLGGLNVTVRRNAFGRQVDSFEEDLDVTGLDSPVRGVFIRAPWVERVGDGVEVLARSTVTGPTGVANPAVAVRQGNLLATSFHPELTEDARLHQLFLDLC